MAGGKGLEATRNVLSWINWFSLAGCCAYEIYWCFAHLSGDLATRILISFYILCFGIIGILFEFGQKHVRNGMSFLGTRGGRAAVFVLAGTLGFTFAFPLTSGEPDRIVAFVMSCFSIFVAIFNLVVLCCVREHAGSDLSQEARPIVAEPGAGPNKI